MSLHEANRAVFGADRRAVSRIAVDCPARLRLTSGDRWGRLDNMSEDGARLRIDNPPKPGTTVLLHWLSHEVFCKVAWAMDDACGLTFEKPLARAVLLETAGEEKQRLGAVAQHSRIPLGQKRSLRPE